MKQIIKSKILLQACIFCTEPDGDWQYGFARVYSFGTHDVDWIIDGNGKRIGQRALHNYELLNLPFGCATNMRVGES